VHGPFYSWLENSSDEALKKSLIDAVHYVLAFTKTHGPFDGIYGFSTGALIATLAVGIATDPNLQDKLLEIDELSELGSLDESDFEESPFRFAVLACAGFRAKDMDTLRRIASIPLPLNYYGGEDGDANLIETKSFHLIGLEDHHKNKSEEIASLYKYSKILYIPG